MGGCRFWEPWEDELVREHYPSHGPSWAEWARLLPDRTQSAIYQRANALRVKREWGYRNEWTREEEKCLLRHVLAVSRETGRSPFAVSQHIYTMKYRFEKSRGKEGE